MPFQRRFNLKDVAHPLRKITIQDIARKAGVSASTVSNVLNNRPEMSAETRKRVLEVVQQFKYNPHVAARNLSRRKTDTIGVVLPWFMGSLGRFFCGVQQAVEPRGYYTLGVGLPGVADRLDTVMKMGLPQAAGEFEVVVKLIREQRVDGILLYTHHMTPAQIRSLKDSPVPVVMTDRRVRGPSLPTVLYENFKAAYEATQHLIDHGYRRIATLTGPLDFVSGRERLDGYKAALRDQGIPLDPTLVVEGDWSGPAPWTAGFVSHFSERAWPQAVLVGNDWMALELLHYTTNHHNTKIASTAIIGFDNVAPSNFAGLTTMSGPIEEFGKAQGSLIVDLIEKKQERSPTIERRVPMQLVKRGSCGCAFTMIKPKTDAD